MKRLPTESPGFFSEQVAQARRFYLTLQPPRDARLTVVSGGYELCAPDYQIRRDTFPFFALEHVADGEGSLTLRGRRFELHPGSLFAYGPGIVHQIQTDPRKPLLKYFVNFAGRGAAQWLRGAGLAAGGISEVYPPREIQPLFDELIRNGQRGTRSAPELCRQLLVCLGLKLREARAPLKSADSHAFATFQRCRNFMQENFLRLRTLEQTARECRVDTAYLCRLFKRFEQQSPYQFLTRLKMNAAAERLQAPDALIKSLAADLGFANPYHFSRVFKSVFSVAPEEFRKLR
jgi:AraC-like DNA-binding protein